MPNSLAGRQRDLHVTVRTDRYRETFELGRRSFINEARLLAHFDHPALVKVLRFWKTAARPTWPCRSTRRARSRTSCAACRPSLRRPGCAACGNRCWTRLAHLHTENCFHRDIAPDNILVLPSGLPLLIDFGAARQVIGDATQALTVILKPGFAPVEQYAESASMRQGAWTDIYALAAVMYHAISGKPPPPAVARLVHDEMVPAGSAGRRVAIRPPSCIASMCVWPCGLITDRSASRPCAPCCRRPCTCGSPRRRCCLTMTSCATMTRR